MSNPTIGYVLFLIPLQVAALYTTVIVILKKGGF